MVSLEVVSLASSMGRKPDSESPQAAMDRAMMLAVESVMSFLKDMMASLVVLRT